MAELKGRLYFFQKKPSRSKGLNPVNLEGIKKNDKLAPSQTLIDDTFHLAADPVIDHSIKS